MLLKLHMSTGIFPKHPLSAWTNLAQKSISPTSFTGVIGHNCLTWLWIVCHWLWKHHHSKLNKEFTIDIFWWLFCKASAKIQIINLHLWKTKWVLTGVSASRTEKREKIHKACKGCTLNERWKVMMPAWEQHLAGIRKMMFHKTGILEGMTCLCFKMGFSFHSSWKELWRV